MIPARIIVVQAMKSTTADHWYGSFAKRLSEIATVEVPEMPTPFAPEADEWQSVLASTIGGVDAETLIIAHSVGNAAVLQYLSILTPGWQLGGLINVAGFSDPQPGNDATIPFVQDIDHVRIRSSTAQRHAIISTDDPEVPAELTSTLARRLDSTVHRIEGAGHFRGSDGYTELPVAEDLALEFARLGRAMRA